MNENANYLISQDAGSGLPRDRRAVEPVIGSAGFSIPSKQHPKSGAWVSAALSSLIPLFHGFDQCMSQLIGTGGLLVTAGIAEQDIRRFLCATTFE